MPVFPADPFDPGGPGGLLTADYQYAFGDLLMGAGTPYIVEKVTGLMGHAETRDNDVDRENSHGSIPGQLLWAPRTIQFDLIVSSQIDGTPVDELLDALSDYFQPPKVRDSLTLSSFAYKRPTRDARQFFARATKFDFDSDYNTGRGLATGSVELVANDPLSYSLELHTDEMTVAGGMASGVLDVTNAGNCLNGSAPIIYITGPAIDPRIENSDDDGREIKLDVSLAANQIARINTETWDVHIQTGGGSNPWVESWNTVMDDSQWWHLMPGENNIVMVRTGTTGSPKLRVDWYDAWARG